MPDQNHPHAPIITVGRYAGVSLDKVPNSYLRWMIGQDFPKQWMEFAKKKLEASDYNNAYLNVSRHALDMFSKRFIERWKVHMRETKGDGDGIASFVANLAQEAWEKGTDVSKHRHQDDGTTKEYDGIKWVFAVAPQYPDYKEVITIMGTD